MSAQDLSRVHRRYVRISNAFKSAWTYHQFLQGVRKVFTHLQAAEYPANFQNLYSELRVVSQNLSETTVETASSQLQQVEAELEPLATALLAADDEISPGQLRMFFQRVKSFDDSILAHLVKFYLYSREVGAWKRDRLDKADFLATKLAEEYHEGRNAFVLRDPTYLRETAEGFWTALGAQPPAADEIGALQEQIQGLGKEFAAADSIDDLHDRGLISSYRELKHRLGDVFFQPQVLQAILEANLALKNQIHRLYRREEQSIIAEYQQVFELERDAPVDMELGVELSEFRTAVDRFEEQLQGENVRLEELAQLRRKVRELVPKLQPPENVTDTGSFVQPPEVRELGVRGEAAPKVSASRSADADEYVREQYDAIVAALDDTNPAVDARKVALQPEIFGLGITPREVAAYRRIYGGAKCDRELEDFVLRAASMRSRIEHEVDEIKSILDDTSVTKKAPQYARAQATVRRADLYLRKFDHRMELAVLDGDADEARALQVLKMRMMRAYSGLWLMVYRN